jgi:hypothetical protein
MKRFFPTIIASVVLALSLFSLSACTKTPEENPIDTLEERVAAMTLEEKLGQMIQAERNAINSSAVNALNLGSILSGGGSHPNPNTPQGWLSMTTSFRNASLNSSSGLPVLYGVDAVHGHNNLLGAVLFPHNIALGATRDADLVERIGAAVAIQLKATGVPWNFAPCVAVVQDLRWGRTYESFGENPTLVSELGVAYTLGLQGEGVLATAKHYVADGGTDFNPTTATPSIKAMSPSMKPRFGPCIYRPTSRSLMMPMCTASWCRSVRSAPRRCMRRSTGSMTCSKANSALKAWWSPTGKPFTNCPDR